jgi:hypothetical protein
VTRQKLRGSRPVGTARIFIPSPSSWSSRERVAVFAIAAASGVIGALAGCEPVGSTVTDHLLSAGIAFAVALAAANASGIALAIAAAMVVAGGDTWQLRVAGLIALVAIAIVERTGRPLPVARALIGTLLVQALLRLPWVSPVGGSAAVAFVAMTIVIVSGVRRAPDPTRRVLVYCAGGAVALVVLAGVASVVAVAQSRTGLENGEQAARAGVDAARNGDRARAADDFAEAGRRFADADRTLGSWLTFPARQLPLVGPQLRTLASIASIGARTIPVARTAALKIDPDRLRLVDGRLDLATLAAYRPTFDDLATRTRSVRKELSELPRTWLVSPLSHQLGRFEATVTRADESAQTAAAAVDVAPSLLGQSGVRHYFVAFVTPAEARGSGGLLANYGVLTASDGRIHLDTVGRGPTLDHQGTEPKHLSGPPDYLARYGKFDPAGTWENVTMSPDFPSVGQVIQELYPQSGGIHVDGAILVDPFAMARLISLSGPVHVPGLPVITAQNAVTFLFRDQYTLVSDPSVRADLLGDIARAVFDQLTTGRSAQLSRIAQTLNPVISAHNLGLWFDDAHEQAFVRRIHADAALPPVVGDSFGVIVQNGGGSKIDYYLHRTIKYSATVSAATGKLQAHAVVVLRNDSPATGVPLYVIGNGVGLPPGTSRLYLSFFSSYALDHAEIDGQPFSLLAERELGRNTYSEFVDIPPGGSRTITLDLSGTVDLSSGTFHFDYLPQVLPNADRVNWSTNVDGGRVVAAVGSGASPVAVKGGVHSASVSRTNAGGPWSVDLRLRR